MKVRTLCGVLCLAGASATPLLAADEHKAAPMMAPADAPVREQEFEKGNRPEGRQATAQDILERFRARFAGEDPLRFAVFWNRELPERISDWRSQRRVVLGISGEAKGTDQDKATDLESRGAITSQAEYRGTRRHYDSDTAFALQSGLIRALREAGVSVIDQALAQRITDNALEDGTFARLSPDRARLAMRALDRHAEYVLELTAGENFGDEATYNVRVLSVNDASILASFTTPARPPETSDQTEWVTTESGYEKRERPLSMTQVGRELALETLSRMAPR
jgi:hypothetical protein